MLKHILPLIPEHTVYTETFFEAGLYSFLKTPVKCEVINDLNREAMNFYSTVVKQFDELQTEIQSTLYGHDSYSDAKLIYNNPHLFDNVKRAASFFTLIETSFGGDMHSFGFSKDNRQTKCFNNKKEAFTVDVKNRLENTLIESDDALKVITRYDSPDTFHYVDPPYFNSDCSHYAGYLERDFKDLLEVLSKVKGKFLLSSYPSDILNEYVLKNGWHTKGINQTVCVNNKMQNQNKKKAKVEVLTANYLI